MIDALVKFGTKGQDVVLSTMGKIKKGKADLVKKANVNFAAMKAAAGGSAGGSAGGGAKFAGVRKEVDARKEVMRMERQAAATSGQEKLAEMRKEQFENNKLVKSTKAAGAALSDIAKGAATLDPVAFIQSTLNAAGKVAGGAIPLFGGAVAGAAELAGVSVGAAGGAIGSAKQSTAGALEIQKRNAQNNLYGGELSFGKKEAAQKAAVEKDNAAAIAKAQAVDNKRNFDDFFKKAASGKYGGGNVSNTAADLQQSLLLKAQTVDTTDKGRGWTPTDKTQFIQSVSGAFGKIQKPLAETLNSFIDKGKNVEQFTQVASGNWNALGTDEGAILQQISNGFSSALPSVRQELQKELLKSYGDKVADEKDTALAGRRATAAAWERQGETQTNRIANVAAKMGDTLFKLDASLNAVQVKLIQGADKLATAVNAAVDIIRP